MWARLREIDYVRVCVCWVEKQLAVFLSVSLQHTQTQLALSLPVSHTLSLSPSLSLSVIHAHIHPLSLPHIHTHTRKHTHTHTLSVEGAVRVPSLSLPPSLPPSFSPPLSLTYAHTHTHTRWRSCDLSTTSTWPRTAVSQWREWHLRTLAISPSLCMLWQSNESTSASLLCTVCCDVLALVYLSLLVGWINLLASVSGTACWVFKWWSWLYQHERKFLGSVEYSLWFRDFLCFIVINSSLTWVDC